MVTQQATLKVNFLVKSKTNSKPLSNQMKYFFVLLHVVYALDFGFIKHKSAKINILIKLIASIQSTIFTIALGFTFFDPSYKNIYTYSSFVLDTLLVYAFTFTLVFAKNTFHDYQNELHSFDVEIKVDSSKCSVENKIFTGYSILMVYRLLTFWSYYYFNLDYINFPFSSQLIYMNGLVALDTVLIVYSSVFYSAYLRMIHFTSFVRNDKSDLVSCHYLYKSLVDIVEKVKTSFDVVMILTLIANTTDVTTQVYLPFANETVRENKTSPLLVAFAYTMVLEQLLVLFLPAFTAGLLAGQVDNLRLVLFDKTLTLEEKGASTKQKEKDIRRFTDYIDGRPLRFRVWRVVPLDWRLPVVVVNVIITYLIVMIQFTHKN